MAVFKRTGSPYYQYEFEINGQRFRGSTREKREARARTYESNERAKIMAGQTPLRARKIPTLAQAAEEFLAEITEATLAGNKAANTARHYASGWKLLQETPIANTRIDLITRGRAATLKFRGGPWYARAAQKTLARILQWSAEKGYISAAPSIAKTRAYGRSMRIDADTEARLLQHMERDVADVFIIMLDCGMRPEEVLRMRWEHVDWTRKEYFVTHGKTINSRRYVPISDRMAIRLRERKDNESEWVFPSPGSIDDTKLARAKDMLASGASVRKVSLELDISWPLAKSISQGERINVTSRRGHRVTVAKQWEAARAAAQVDPKLVLYCARHEFATSFLEQGGNLATLKAIMGHESITTTEKYLHPLMGEKAHDIVNQRNIHNAGLKLVKRRA